MELTSKLETWRFARPFKIAFKTRTQLNLVSVALRDGEHIGRGEGIGVSYRGETAQSVLEDIERVRPQIEAGVDRDALESLLPAGGARNALDCALWDLECKRERRSIFELTETSANAVQSVYTISVDTPEIMAEQARTGPSTHLKIKLDAEIPVERVQAIREARPDAVLIVDANQSWTIDLVKRVAEPLAELGVAMIEQPLRAGEDKALDNYTAPVPIGADESVQTVDDLEGLASGYSVINIKLDKTGGLTGAFALADAARARGYELMVGCMAGTSLSMAPAFVIAQRCRFVDIDGPLLLADDRLPGMSYDQGKVTAQSPNLWG